MNPATRKHEENVGKLDHFEVRQWEPGFAYTHVAPMRD